MASRYDDLLNNARVRRWYENLARGSPARADIFLRRLGAFCERHRMTPNEMAKLNERKAYDLLLDAVTDLERQKLAGSYISHVIQILRSWLAFNGVEVRGRIKVRGAQETPTLQDERVPSQDELRKILLSGDRKTRTVCVLLAQAGLRPEVLGNYRGTDGLRVGDLPELMITDGQVTFSKIPALVGVRPGLSKAGHTYFSFLGEEGCEHLKDYLDARLRSGEQIGPSSPVVRPKTAKKEFISTINLGDAVRKAVRAAGFPWRPYVLRAYFATNMMLAESKGLIIRDYRSFFMGHKGDIEHVYTLNKKHLPPTVVEEMRSAYAKAERFLEAVPREPAMQDVETKLRKQLLLVAGLRPNEITDQQLALADTDFQRLVRERLGGGPENSRERQRVVQASDIDERLREGWQFVSLLPDGKAILARRDAM